MPAIIAALGAVLINLFRLWALSIVGRVLATIGLGIFAYTYAVPELMTWVGQQFSALPTFMRQSIGYAGVDAVATMVLSALAVKAVARVFLGKNS